jgi:site-specific DNA-methyltransferase (adenine-specific)
MTYDPADNARKCYDLAIETMREKLNSFRKEVIGDAVLYLGDCREVLPLLPRVDVVFTDPPYGDDATHAGHLSCVTLKNGEPARQALGFDGITSGELTDLTRQLVNAANRWVVLSCEWKHVSDLDAAGLLVRFGIWRKPDGAPQFTGDRPGMGWEAVAICHRPGRKYWNGGGSHAFWSVPKHGTAGHPTEKPIGLLAAWVRDFSDAGETILDPFMGSGTAGVAAAKYGRRFIGIERDPKWFAVACRRIRDAYSQPDMFVEAAKVPPAEQLSLLGAAE